jgi:hypothetical protein
MICVARRVSLAAEIIIHRSYRGVSNPSASRACWSGPETAQPMSGYHNAAERKMDHTVDRADFLFGSNLFRHDQRLGRERRFLRHPLSPGAGQRVVAIRISSSFLPGSGTEASRGSGCGRHRIGGSHFPQVNWQVKAQPFPPAFCLVGLQRHLLPPRRLSRRGAPPLLPLLLRRGVPPRRPWVH